MYKNLRRSVVALATTLACFAIMANPTSAAKDVVVINGGTFVSSNSTGTTVVSIALGAAGAGCTSSFAVEVGTGSHSGTSDVTTFTSVGHFVFSGVHYVAKMTRVTSMAGTFGTSSTGGTISSLNLTLSIQIIRAHDQSSTDFGCSTSTSGTNHNAIICTLRAAGHFNGTYNGHMSDVSNNFTLTGTGTLASFPPGCQVPFAALNGGHFTLTNVTGHTTATSP